MAETPVGLTELDIRNAAEAILRAEREGEAMTSELTRYSAVTPNRPDATCLIAERSGFLPPPGSGK